ncbi:hypothetical protein [Methanobacterium sp.]|uniref:hypothetical protein n=1 Tax=Methanobacterium sp. TaxID=2164 RepID=UPI003C73A3DB
MIENNIKTLRQAAKVSTVQDSDEIWCLIAGNEEMVNNIAYEAITDTGKVEILCREHITSKESFVTKIFDFIILHGDINKIRDLSLMCKNNGGAYLKIVPYYVLNEPNLILTVGYENTIKKFMGDCEKSRIKLNYLIEDKTTGFIDTDVYITNILPGFIRSTIDPLFKMTDVVLSTVLISAVENVIPKIKEIAKTNKIFVIEFNKIMKED